MSESVSWCVGELESVACLDRTLTDVLTLRSLVMMKKTLKNQTEHQASTGKAIPSCWQSAK